MITAVSIGAVAAAQPLGGAARPARARVDDRAALGARTHAVGAARIEHVAAEPAERGDGVDPEQLRRLRVEIADAAIAVDREHSLDDAAEERLRFGFAALDLGGEPAQLLAHALHGGGEAAQLEARGVRDRHVEVAGADALGRHRHAADGPRQQPAERRRQGDHEQRHQDGEEQQAPQQEVERGVDRGSRKTGLDQRDRPCRRASRNTAHVAVGPERRQSIGGLSGGQCQRSQRAFLGGCAAAGARSARRVAGSTVISRS